MDKKTKQYPTSEARVSPEAQNQQTKGPDNDRQLELECPMRPEINKEKDQTLPNNWSLRHPLRPEIDRRLVETTPDSSSQSAL